MFNPLFLNSVLHKAVTSSLYSNNNPEYGQDLTFAVRKLPSTLNHQGNRKNHKYGVLKLSIFLCFVAPSALDSLDLRYRISWPTNIVITESSMKIYSKVFTFLLRLKRSVWSLTNVWIKLKRDGENALSCLKVLCI